MEPYILKEPVYSDLQVVQVPQEKLVLQDDGAPQLLFNEQQQQQQTQHHQIVYRMAANPQQQQRPISMLNNAHVIVQQPSGQSVLIQAPQGHQELIMRQQGINIHAYNNRVVYTTSPQQQQQQLQLQAQTAHLVQTRVVPQQAPNQVVYQQVQMQKTQPPQQQQQAQQQPQLVASAQPQAGGAPGTPQLVRTGFRGKSPRGGVGGAAAGGTIVRHASGTLIATRPTLAPTIVRHVRPRGGGTAGVASGLVRNMRPAGIRPATRTQLVVQTTTTGSEMQLVAQNQPAKQITITNLGQQQDQTMAMQPRHVYRTQMLAESQVNPQQQQQQQQQQHQMLMMRQGPIRYRAQAPPPVASSPVAGGAGPTSVVGPLPPMATQTNPGGGVNHNTMDLEERIQAAVLQKKEQQKPPTPSGAAA
ncbi:uncharacterized protein Dwil_GK28037 [Drosophila willistoni]|uniref:Uncharacterized protein n=1 Tax=Drosophila willistoni TaxID=7260 RepID=A0A0Q9WRN8_DROWI|nr:uncharacterized protein Dwil_GK28037 [Drosophila willistoni]